MRYISTEPQRSQIILSSPRAGAAMRSCASAPVLSAPLPDVLVPRSAEAEIRNIAWEKCGISRSGEELQQAREMLCSTAMISKSAFTLNEHELRSIHTVVLLIARCALARQESRGAHYRIDFAGKRSEFEKHSVVSRDNDVSFWAGTS